MPASCHVGQRRTTSHNAIDRSRVRSVNGVQRCGRQSRDDIQEAGNMATATLDRPGILDDETIAQFGERAAGYDRENRFFTEDFEAMRASGYLRAAVPADLGGGGLN